MYARPPNHYNISLPQRYQPPPGANLPCCLSSITSPLHSPLIRCLPLHPLRLRLKSPSAASAHRVMPGRNSNLNSLAGEPSATAPAFYHPQTTTIPTTTSAKATHRHPFKRPQTSSPGPFMVSLLTAYASCYLNTAFGESLRICDHK